MSPRKPLGTILGIALAFTQPHYAEATDPVTWPDGIGSADFLDRATAENAVVIDIRHLGEKPRQIALATIIIVRLPWPGEVDHPQTPLKVSTFFKRLKILHRKHSERQLVLLCGVGERSAVVLNRAPSYGVKSGLSQITGGPEGNEEDPGLLMELSLR
jgi:hypothetical protein